MTEDRRLLSADIIDTVPAIVTILMLALSSLTFIYDKLFSQIMAAAGIGTADFTQAVWVIVIAVIVLIPFVFLRIWSDLLLTAATYLSWLLFLPSVLYYSGIDLFRILSISANFGIFASDLSFTVIALAGILLACGSLAVRTFGYLKTLRRDFLARGADRSEVRRALFRNAVFELELIAAAGLATFLFAYFAPTLGQRIQDTLKAFSSAYLLIALGAIALLVLVFVLLLWPRKNGEKE